MNYLHSLSNFPGSSKWKTHNSKISKLCVKVKAKITKVNKITKEAKKKEINMAGAQSVDDDEDIQINEITFQHFIDGTSPWETHFECKVSRKKIRTEKFHLLVGFSITKKSI